TSTTTSSTCCFGSRVQVPKFSPSKHISAGYLFSVGKEQEVKQVLFVVPFENLFSNIPLVEECIRVKLAPCQGIFYALISHCYKFWLLVTTSQPAAILIQPIKFIGNLLFKRLETRGR